MTGSPFPDEHRLGGHVTETAATCQMPRSTFLKWGRFVLKHGTAVVRLTGSSTTTTPPPPTVSATKGAQPDADQDDAPMTHQEP